MTKWTRHYTGLEYAEQRLGPFALYRSRERSRYMVRLSFRHRMLGVFWNTLNYGSEWGRGLELFTGRWHAGFIWKSGPLWGWRKRVGWSGSLREPYSTCTVRLGRFYVGRRTPRWLLKIKERREQAAWEKAAEVYERAFSTEDFGPRQDVDHD